MNRLTISLASDLLISGLANPALITQLAAKRAGATAYEVQFSHEGVGVELPEGTQFRFGVKAKGKLGADYLVFSASFSKSGTGSSTLYRVEPDWRTEEISAAFSASNEPDILPCTLEVQWTTPDGQEHGTQLVPDRLALKSDIYQPRVAYVLADGNAAQTSVGCGAFASAQAAYEAVVGITDIPARIMIAHPITGSGGYFQFSVDGLSYAVRNVAHAVVSGCTNIPITPPYPSLTHMLDTVVAFFGTHPVSGVVVSHDAEGLIFTRQGVISQQCNPVRLTLGGVYSGNLGEYIEARPIYRIHLGVGDWSLDVSALGDVLPNIQFSGEGKDFSQLRIRGQGISGVDGASAVRIDEYADYDQNGVGIGEPVGYHADPNATAGTDATQSGRNVHVIDAIGHSFFLLIEPGALDGGNGGAGGIGLDGEASDAGGGSGSNGGSLFAENCAGEFRSGNGGSGGNSGYSPGNGRDAGSITLINCIGNAYAGGGGNAAYASYSCGAPGSAGDISMTDCVGNANGAACGNFIDAMQSGSAATTVTMVRCRGNGIAGPRLYMSAGGNTFLTDCVGDAYGGGDAGNGVGGDATVINCRGGVFGVLITMTNSVISAYASSYINDMAIDNTPCEYGTRFAASGAPSSNVMPL